MANKKSASDNNTDSIVKGIMDDAGQLIEKQFELLRSELGQELGKVQKAATSLGAGAGLVGLAGILGAMGVVHFVHEATRLPLWLCYGLGAGLCGAAGTGLVTTGVSQAADVQLIPPRTAQTLRDDAASVGQAVTSAAGGRH